MRKRDGSQEHDNGAEEVEAFLASLDHPLKPEILAVLQIILGADPGITEGIKWNAPSFRKSEWLATFHLRAKAGLQVILHLGANVGAVARHLKRARQGAWKIHRMIRC